MHRTAVVGLMLLLASSGGAAQQSKVAKISFFVNMTDGDLGNLYVVSGGERNALIVGAEDETIIIDTNRSAGWAKPILDKVRNVTDQPVKRIINTNPHNIGSNAEFTTAMEIIAHANAKSVKATRRVADTLSITVKTTGEEKGKNRIDLFHFGPAFTNADLVVVLPQYNVAFLGDVYPGKMVPEIDVDNGGSGLAFPDTLAKAIAAIKDAKVSIIAPGAAAPPPVPIIPQWATLADLQEYADFTRDFLAAVKAGKSAGKTPEQTVADMRLPERYKAYDMTNAAAAARAIYRELN